MLAFHSSVTKENNFSRIISKQKDSGTRCQHLILPLAVSGVVRRCALSRTGVSPRQERFVGANDGLEEDKRCPSVLSNTSLVLSDLLSVLTGNLLCLQN